MFTKWHPPSGIDGFVRTLYLNVLDREAESQAVVDHHKNIAYRNGIATTIKTFFAALVDRDKPPAEVIVNKLYRSIMGREAEEGGLKHHVRAINQGRSIGKVVDDFLGSDEYSLRERQGLVPNRHPTLVMDELAAVKDQLAALRQLPQQIETLSRQVEVLQRHMEDEVRW